MEKIIHYCWFGPKPLGKLEQKCLKSWQKFFPDYKIMKWSEENVDLNECEFIKEAYAQKKWAFVADYARTKALYQYGGIYFDTDMEVIRNMDELIDNTLALGIEDSGNPAAGIIIVPDKKNKYLKKLLDTYKKMKFNESGNLFEITIPVMFNKIFEDLKIDHKSNEIQRFSGVTIYPREYFYPFSYDMQNNIFTEKTKTIHYYSGSWTGKGEKLTLWMRRHKMNWAVKPTWVLIDVAKKILRRG